MAFFLIFVFGTFCGFFSSSPPGPINLWVWRHLTLPDHGGKLKHFIAGVILGDLCWIFLVQMYFNQEFSQIFEDRSFHLLSGTFLILLSFFTFYKNLRSVESKKATSTFGPQESYPFLSRTILEFYNRRKSNIHSLTELTLGGLFCLTNPGFFIFWAFCIQYLQHELGFNFDFDNFIPFCLGAVLGDLLWFAFFIKISSKLGIKILNNRIHKLNHILSWSLFLFGVFALYKYFQL